MTTSHATPHQARAMGELRLDVELRGGRSVVAGQYHRGALSVLRPMQLDPWQVTCMVVNPGGGYLGGDRYQLDVRVGDGAGLLVTTQSATKVYRTPTAAARQHSTLQVGEGALLEVLPDQLVVYREGDYRQDTRAVVHQGGTCIMADVVTPGWAPDGTGFGYQGVALRTIVERPGDRVVAVDNLHLAPSLLPASALGVLDGHSHAGSLLAVDHRVGQEVCDRVHDLLAGLPGVVCGTSLGPDHLLAVRVLGDSTGAVQSALMAVDAYLRHEWFGLAPVDLRKG